MEKIWLVKGSYNTDGEWTFVSYAHKTKEGAVKEARDLWRDIFTSGHFNGAKDGFDGCIAEENREGTFFDVWDEYDCYSARIEVDCVELKD